MILERSTNASPARVKAKGTKLCQMQVHQGEKVCIRKLKTLTMILEMDDSVGAGRRVVQPIVSHTPQTV